MSPSAHVAIAALAWSMGACGGSVSSPAQGDGNGRADEATTTAAAVPGAKPVPEASTLRIIVAGDIVPDGPRLASPEGLDEALGPLSAMFADAQAVVANHEAATADDFEAFAAKRSSWVVPPRWTRQLAKSHIAALTLANDHTCDAGLVGFERTFAVVEDVGMVGLGVDPVDPFRPRVLAARAGRRVCAIAWTARVDGVNSKCGASGKVALAPYGAEGDALIDRAVKSARTMSCDALIAIGHASGGLAAQTEAARAQARVAAAAGADVVVLNHPHVPAGIEVISTEDGRRVPLFLSLGDLVSSGTTTRRRPAKSPWSRVGLLADLTFNWETGASSTPGSGALTWGYELAWTEYERDTLRSGDHVSVRPLDRTRDQAILASLGRDRTGPSRIFESPCWLAVGPGCR